MHKHWGFFPYEAMNYKAAQSYLDRKAEKGLQLKHIYLGSIALFEEAEHPHHFVDLDINHNDFNEPDKEYLQLCADAGWEYLQSLRGMLIFRSLSGANPAPIQSDEEIEWEHFWKKYRPKFWESLLILLSLLLLAFILALPSRRNLTMALAVNSSLAYLAYLVLCFLILPFSWIHSRWYLARCRKADRVEQPGPFSGFLDTVYRLQRPLLYLILLFTVAEFFGAGRIVDLSWSSFNNSDTATVEACRKYPVVLASDLGLPDSDYSRHLDGQRSIFCSALSYSELTTDNDADGIMYKLTTERYQCANEALAKFALRNRKRETEAESNFIWGPLPWENTDGLGFDECYTCRGNSYLLFRQGNIVALVGCSEMDITTPEALAAIHSRILP